MGTVNEVKSDSDKDLARLRSLQDQISHKTHMINALYRELDDISLELPALARVEGNDGLVRVPIDDFEDAVERLQELAAEMRSVWEKHNRS